MVTGTGNYSFFPLKHCLTLPALPKNLDTFCCLKLINYTHPNLNYYQIMASYKNKKMKGEA